MIYRAKFIIYFTNGESQQFLVVSTSCCFHHFYIRLVDYINSEYPSQDYVIINVEMIEGEFIEPDDNNQDHDNDGDDGDGNDDDYPPHDDNPQDGNSFSGRLDNDGKWITFYPKNTNTYNSRNN